MTKIEIILNAFKENRLSLEEATTLLQDDYSNYKYPEIGFKPYTLTDKTFNPNDWRVTSTITKWL